MLAWLTIPSTITVLRALIQQIPSGLYWKTGSGWVREREQADGFVTPDAAILFCIGTEMRDTRIVLTFGDPNLDIILHPFGECGYQPTSQELVRQSRAMKEKSGSLAQRIKATLAGVLQTIAALKERKKQTTFKRKQVGDDEP
jgi:hypothetical protein